MSDGRNKSSSWFAGYTVDRSLYSRSAIAALSQSEYQNLNLWDFALANIARYTKQAIAVHREVFSNNEPEEICHEIMTFAVEQLMRKHKENFDAVGHDRVIILFTTLRVLCSKYVPRIMATKYNVRLERRTGSVDSENGRGGTGLPDVHDIQHAADAGERVSYAAAESDVVHDHTHDSMGDRWDDENDQIRRIGIQLTLINEHITGRDMTIMTQSILDARSNAQIAENCDTKREIILVTKHRLRKKLLKLGIEKGEALRNEYAKELAKEFVGAA